VPPNIKFVYWSTLIVHKVSISILVIEERMGHIIKRVIVEVTVKTSY
jgi:hypothetical protein